MQILTIIITCTLFSLPVVASAQYTIYGNRKVGNPAYEFTITMNNDSVFVTEKTRMNVREVPNSILVGGRKITPDQTKSISIVSSKERWIGVPADSCWYFVISKGRRSRLYSNIPGPPHWQRLPECIAFDFDNHPIMRLNESNLIPFAEGNEKAMKKLRNRNLVDVVRFAD